MSQTYRYHTCPACGHPNVHTEKPDNYAPWRFRAHFAGQTARRCPGSLVPVTGEPRTEPITRNSRQHAAELAAHAPA